MMGSSNAALIMTLVNSIIGVSILAMPFCYKQCGILLASLILIFSNLMTRLSCHYLLKSAIMTRRRTFELLAFHALGPAGKITVELSIILLMIGTCIAFFVVMGDLSPPIIGSLLDLKLTSALRPAVLLGLALFVVLPLGLLRNVDSLSSICTASFLFYLFLVFKVFTECTNNLFSGSWIDEVHFWRPAGILQCLPIFSMALSCQTQLLEVFDSAPNGTLDRMNSIVKSAVNLCTTLYISVGFFGYIAYYKQPFSGNLLMSFSESYFSEFIKLGFVLSVAVTFPMVIFPCRASLHSLLFKKAHVPHYELVTGGGNHIPEAQFKCITFFIITVSLIAGLLAPNIEIVLGLLGSTIGVIICFLCPPILFTFISSKATTEKVLAQFLCVFGIFIMVMGTYANLFLSEPVKDLEVQNWKPIEQDTLKLPDAPLKEVPPKIDLPIDMKDIAQPPADAANKPSALKVEEAIHEAKNPAPADVATKEDKRVEPPIPEAPPKSKETAEQPVAPDNAENKPIVELQIPAVSLDNDVKEPQLKAVGSNKKNKHVEPPSPVDPAGAAPLLRKSAAPSPLPQDSGEKNAAIIEDTKKLAPPPVQKSLSSGEKRLRTEQKEVLERMRGAKNKDGKQAPASVDTKKVENKKDPSLEKRAPQSLTKEDQKVDAPPAKSPVQRAQEKPPLPLLVHSNVKEEVSNGAGPDAPLKREILGSETSDREKRDLYYVTEIAPEGKTLTVEPKDNVSSKLNSQSKQTDVEASANVTAAKKEDRLNDENLTCEKDSKSEKSTKDVKIGPEASSNDSKPKPADSADIKVEKPLSSNEKEVSVDSKKGDIVHEVSSSNSKEQLAESETAGDNKDDNILIAPSKLSDPVVRLPEKVPIDDKLKPAFLNVMKPMSRELKTVKDKPITNNKQK